MSLVISSKTSKPLESNAIEIALLNNLSDAGFEVGERQFTQALKAGAGENAVRLRLFSLPSIPRGSSTRARIEATYTDFSELTSSRIDGLIVTGCEPMTSALPDETFWPQLTEVIDWAEHNTRSAVWSCLAAHAAVLHLDGIQRRRHLRKFSGLYRAEVITPHPLLDGAKSDMSVSHSRWNDLHAPSLINAGYKILTQVDGSGVDMFVKQWRSLFIYLQGHPEYDSDALRREYRRDVARYLDGVSGDYPNAPANYFAPGIEANLAAFEKRARSESTQAHLADLPLERVVGDARSSHYATMFFHNWLDALRVQRHRQDAGLT